jgi:hypothetical protein
MITLHLVCALLSTTFAGDGSARGYGRDPEFWKTACIAYGVLREITSDKDGTTLKLSVEATLTGAYDAAQRSTLTARTSAVPGAASSWQFPPVNSKVIVLVEKIGDKFVVPATSIPFFPPPRGPVLQVKNLDDPAVEAILSKVFQLKMQAKHASEDDKKPAAK